VATAIYDLYANIFGFYKKAKFLKVIWAISMWTAIHVMAKRTWRVCEGDYYIYTKKLKSTVIVRLLRVIRQSKIIAKTKWIACQV